MTPLDDRPRYMISVAADLVGMHPQTLRIYEAKGLVRPRRTPGGTRLYSDRDLERLRLIQRLTTELGLNLAGVEVVLRLEDEPWPDVGRRVGEAVAQGDADRGIVCCWTGTGVSIAANKVPGVRAALCTDAETARGARRWNDANVLALGLRLTSPVVATEILDAFLATETDPDEKDNISLLT